MRGPIRLMSGNRKRRTDPIGTILTIAPWISWYGGWFWLEYHHPALGPWLCEHPWLLRFGGAILVILAVAILLVTVGVHNTIRRAPHRRR